MALLTGRARLWVAAAWAREEACCATFKSFSEELTTLFDPASPEVEATLTLLNLTQGTQSVLDYIVEFRSLATDTTWNDSALYGAFYIGINKRIKDALALQGKLKTLKELF